MEMPIHAQRQRYREWVRPGVTLCVWFWGIGMEKEVIAYINSLRFAVELCFLWMQIFWGAGELVNDLLAATSFDQCVDM